MSSSDTAAGRELRESDVSADTAAVTDSAVRTELEVQDSSTRHQSNVKTKIFSILHYLYM